MGIKLIRYLPSVVWMGVIFYLSQQPASESREISGSLLTYILNVIPISSESGMILHGMVLKLAPFVAYLILGLLLYLAYRRKSSILFIFSICLLVVILSTEYQMGLHTLLRKSAHFLAYAMLGMLIYFAYRGRHAVLFTLIVCLLFAISDEVHQLFIPGRSGEVRDVVIDLSGATFGLIVYKLGLKITSRRG